MGKVVKLKLECFVCGHFFPFDELIEIKTSSSRTRKHCPGCKKQVKAIMKLFKGMLDEL